MVCLTAATSCVPAYASHLRGTSLSWAPTATPGTVTFILQYSQTVSSGCGGPCVVGGTLNVSISTGDGHNVNILTTITSVNTAQDFFSSVGTANYTYSTPGTYTAAYDTCCRTGAIKNFSAGNIRMETTVTPFGGVSPAVVSMPAIITVPLQASTTFQLYTVSPTAANLSYRLSTTQEAYDVANPSCSHQLPPGMTVNSSTGLVTWNTSQITAAGCGYSAPASGDQWTVQFMVQELDSSNNVVAKTPIDMIVELVTSAEQYPTLNFDKPGPLTVPAGSLVAFNATANDAAANSVVTLNAVGVPSGATTTNSNQALAPPQTSNFSWTPTAAQAGTSYIVTYSATNDTFEQALNAVILNVTAAASPTVNCPASLSAQYNSPLAIPITVLDPQSEALTVVWSNDSTQVHTDTVAATSSTTNLSLSQTFTTVGAHTVSVIATNTGSATATCSTAVTVTQATPTLAFAAGTATATYTYGQAPVAISATSASSAAVAYSVISGPATINATSGVLTFTGAGTVVLNAAQAAGTNYTAASAQVTLIVGPATPTLAFAAGTASALYTYGQAPVAISATSASSAAVTYSVVSGPATINATSGLMTLTGTGTVTLNATQAASTNYTAASAQVTLTVGPATPTLAFAAGTATATYTYGQPPVTLTATSVSTAAVTYSVVSGPASINATSGLMTPTAAGTVVIKALQAASANYTGALAQVTLTVSPATPTLAFATGTSSATYTYGQAPVTLSATSNSSAAITYSVVSGSATINATSGLLTLTGGGPVIIKAAQAATTNYTATSAQVTITVGQQSALISIATSATSVTPIQPVTLTATVTAKSIGTPSGTVTFYDNGTAIGSAATLSSGSTQLQLASLLSGSHTITAAYSGDPNFVAIANTATTSPVTITVAPLSFTLKSLDLAPFETLASDFAKVNYPIAISPTYGTYPGPVTFTVSGAPAYPQTYSLTPSSLKATDGPQTLNLTIYGGFFSLHVRNQKEPHSPWSTKGGVLLVLLLPLFLFQRNAKRTRTSYRLLSFIALTFATMSITSCGGGADKFSTITVTATSGGISQSVFLTLDEN
jgi:hypothetical protein